MNFVALGIGGLMIAGGAYLSFVQKKKTEGLVTELKYMKAVSLAELKDSWQSLADEGMAEGFRDLVETNGKADTDGEVKAPYSNVACAYFEATVTREFEKEERSTDKDGKVQMKRTRSSEIVSSRKSPSPLYVADGNVRVGVDMDGATLHPRTERTGSSRTRATRPIRSSGFSSPLPRECGRSVSATRRSLFRSGTLCMSSAKRATRRERCVSAGLRKKGNRSSSP